MATASSRGTSVVSTSGTTWSSTGNAFDGTVGTNNATYATWVNAARNSIGTIEIGGYSFGLSGSETINSVSCNIRHIENSTTNINSVTVQLEDSTGTAIGTAVSATESTSTHTDNLTLGTPTAAQAAAGLRAVVTVGRRSTTTSTTFSLDYVDLTVDYTPGLPLPFDSAGAGAQFQGINASGSWSHIIAGNALLVVVDGFTTSATVPTVQVGTTNISLLSGGQFTGGFNRYSYLFGLLNPPTDPINPQTVSVAWSDGGSYYMSANSFSYSGVGSFGTIASLYLGTNVVSASQTVTTVPTDGVIFQFFYQGNNSAGVSTGNQNSRWSIASNTSYYATLVQDASGAASVTFTATNATAGPWTGVALPLLAPVGPTVNSGQFFAMM